MPPAAVPDDVDTLADSRYVSLTTFRRSGAPVATPVWVARDGDELVVITVDPSGKLKRLAHDPRVELRPCDMRGRVPERAMTYAGTAVVDRTSSGVAAVKRAIGRKYVLARLGDVLASVTDRIRPRTPRAAIRITLD
ncbi:PPOX class F420-dependent oxidoreductase [Terrabacter sp. NPDC080008]|uniref:PPOX class F420-dependent oxidoreductase n=1 Tax=Terrabacter sp. NPDC080008 TaxID=3155176 RepID=UPI00344E4E8F